MGNGKTHNTGIDINADNEQNPNPDIVAWSWGVVYVSTACTIVPCTGSKPETNDGYGNVLVVGYDYNNLPQFIQEQVSAGSATVFLLYAHLNAPSALNEGDKVYPGQVLGQMGTTGNSTGIHLHFEIRVEVNGQIFQMGDFHNGDNYTYTHFAWHNKEHIKPLNPKDFFEIN